MFVDPLKIGAFVIEKFTFLTTVAKKRIFVIFMFRHSGEKKEFDRYFSIRKKLF